MPVRDVAEISGINTFHVERKGSKEYFHALFNRYYDENGDKELITGNNDC